MPNELSIELSYDEMREVITAVGFEFIVSKISLSRFVSCLLLIADIHSISTLFLLVLK